MAAPALNLIFQFFTNFKGTLDFPGFIPDY